MHSNIDPCLYVSRNEGEETDLIVTVYVGDLVIAGRLGKVRDFKQTISQRFKMKDLGPVSHALYLGDIRATAP